ncbi:HAD family hydrolase [Bacteroides sp.]|uniref:HAD family hydrolase n=1 Tax=Bacteroides sp. TaxID=29523 RepID=UPI003D0D6681
MQNIYQRGITITVASSKGRDALLLLLNKLNISQYISYTLGEQDVVNKKPAPDMVLMILEQTQSTPQQTLVIASRAGPIVIGDVCNRLFLTD